ncbi:MAG: ACT domain-containing protein [Bacillota bacterium]|nr:ACT domain-containing protein [Bacillota bacterium]
MFIKQLSIFVENSPGRMISIIRILEENHIDIRALSLSDTSDFGILRLIVSSPEHACEALRAKGSTVRITEVLGIGITDQPGGLGQAVQLLSEQNINIEYMYAFTSPYNNNAYVILRVEENEAAAAVLQAGGVELLTPEDVYAMGKK